MISNIAIFVKSSSGHFEIEVLCICLHGNTVGTII